MASSKVYLSTSDPHIDFQSMSLFGQHILHRTGKNNRRQLSYPHIVTLKRLGSTGETPFWFANLDHIS